MPPFGSWGSILPTFWAPLPSIWPPWRRLWLPLGSILAPFSSSLTSIWPPWRRLGRVARNVHENTGFSSFWLHFGTSLAPKTDLFRVRNCIDLFINFRSHFGSMFGAFVHHCRVQNRARIRKCDFVKMSFSCTRGAHFQGCRPPRSIQKSIKKTIEK